MTTKKLGVLVIVAIALIAVVGGFVVYNHFKKDNNANPSLRETELDELEKPIINEPNTEE
ncbi:MAG TPA: hypothetical protein PLP27_10915 [Crocinitomicaceae bacterium]|nr:hypothetical protein [Crocinitomicaceae bacterium]